MSEVEIYDIDIKNLKDLHRQQRLLRVQIQQKELEVKKDFREFKEEMSFSKIAGKGFKMGMQSIKNAITGSSDDTKQTKRKGFMANVARFGTFALTSWVASKSSRGIGRIFNR